MGEISVMGTSRTLRQILGEAEWVTGGDTRILWDSSKREETDNAKEMFQRLTGKGYRAFSVSRSGEKGEQIDRFDPNAEKIIFVPPMAGGAIEVCEDKVEVDERECQIEAVDEQIVLAKRLGLTMQVARLTAVRNRVLRLNRGPLFGVELTADQYDVLRLYFNNHWPLEKFEAETVPMHVLKTIEAGKEVFSTVYIYNHADRALGDPIVLGVDNPPDKSRRYFLLARWGDGLRPWSFFVKFAADVYTPSVRQLLRASLIPAGLFVSALVVWWYDNNPMPLTFIGIAAATAIAIASGVRAFVYYNMKRVADPFARMKTVEW